MLEQHQFTHLKLKQLQDKKHEDTRKYKQNKLLEEEKQIKNKVLEHKNLEVYEEECLRRLQRTYVKQGPHPMHVNSSASQLHHNSSFENAKDLSINS